MTVCHCQSLLFKIVHAVQDFGGFPPAKMLKTSWLKAVQYQTLRLWAELLFWIKLCGVADSGAGVGRLRGLVSHQSYETVIPIGEEKEHTREEVPCFE